MMGGSLDVDVVNVWDGDGDGDCLLSGCECDDCIYCCMCINDLVIVKLWYVKIFYDAVVIITDWLETKAIVKDV